VVKILRAEILKIKWLGLANPNDLGGLITSSGSRLED
jgi:hypothetical protein